MEGVGVQRPGEEAIQANPADVTRLCELLAALIEQNGSQRPDHTLRSWTDPCRLMIERDGRTPDQIEYVIRWCQKDHFWRASVLSMQKLRRQFDRLVLEIKRQREGRSPRRAVVPRLALTPREAAESMGVAPALFEVRVLPELAVIRIGGEVLISVEELQRWLREKTRGAGLDKWAEATKDVERPIVRQGL